MAAPIQHRAVLRHDQVIQASMASRSRSVSVTWVFVLLFVGLIVAVQASYPVSFWLVQQLPFPVMFAIGTWIPATVTALFAFVVCVLSASIQTWAIRRSYLRNFAALGIPMEIDALFEILPEGLRLSTERLTLFPRWHSIDTVERHELGWVLSADQLTYLVPHASFPDRDVEQAFVRAVIERLSPEARDRSPDALALAGTEPADPRPTAAPAAPALPLEAPVAAAPITAHEMSWAGRVAFDRVAQTSLHTLLYPMLTALVGGMLGMTASGLLLVFLPLTITLANAMAVAALAFVLPLIGGAFGLWLAIAGWARSSTRHITRRSRNVARRRPPTANGRCATRAWQRVPRGARGRPAGTPSARFFAPMAIGSSWLISRQT